MEQKNSLIKSLIEIIPLILFFIVNAKYGIIFATKTFVITTFIALIISYLSFKKISTPLLITSFLVLIFGGLTIFFKDPTFIKLKPVWKWNLDESYTSIKVRLLQMSTFVKVPLYKCLTLRIPDIYLLNKNGRLII